MHPATLLVPALLATALLAPAAPAAPAEAAACGDAATLVHQIQGNGAAFDPAYGGSQTVEGVVTASMLGGVFVQEEAGDADADPLTSEAIFVFLSGRVAPSVGSVIRVTGTVTEFGGTSPKTELTDLTDLQDCGPAGDPVEPFLARVVDITEGPGGSSIVHLDVVGVPEDAIDELRHAHLLPQ